MSEDKGFEVVDKRMKESTETTEEPATADEVEEEAQAEGMETETATEAPQAAEAAEQPEAAEDTGEPEAESKEEARAADVYTIVTWMIGMLATSAWQAMGLQIDPASGEARKDLEQAKVAIDCIMALSDKISGHLDDAGRRELRGIVSDLQINFVNQNKEQ